MSNNNSGSGCFIFIIGYIVFCIAGFIIVREYDKKEIELNKKRTPVEEVKTQSPYYTIIIIDGCEYIKFNIIDRYDGSRTSISHKGNCKNCMKKK
jgi:hypothetical protein